MIVLVVRHGHAVDEARGLADEGRYLSGKGRKQTRKIAARLAKKEKGVAARAITMWTSPLVRAVQTAEIFADALDLKDNVIAVPELVPGKDARDTVAKLEEARRDGADVIALVGHEPLLGQIASLLLGDTFGELAKSGVVAIDWDGARGEKLFYDAPKRK